MNWWTIRLINWLIDQRMCRLIDWLISRFNCWADLWIDWLIDWLCKCSRVSAYPRFFAVSGPESLRSRQAASHGGEFWLQGLQHLSFERCDGQTGLELERAPVSGQCAHLRDAPAHDTRRGGEISAGHSGLHGGDYEEPGSAGLGNGSDLRDGPECAGPQSGQRNGLGLLGHLCRIAGCGSLICLEFSWSSVSHLVFLPFLPSHHFIVCAALDCADAVISVFMFTMAVLLQCFRNYWFFSTLCRVTLPFTEDDFHVLKCFGMWQNLVFFLTFFWYRMQFIRESTVKMLARKRSVGVDVR